MLNFYILQFILIAFVQAYNHKAYDLAVEMSGYCAVSYCVSGSGDFKNNANPLKDGYLSSVCPTVSFCEQDNDIEVVDIFQPKNVTQLSGDGFIAVDHRNGRIVVVSRGTNSLDDWITDFEAALVPYPECDSCYIHDGLKQTTKVIMDDISEVVLDLTNQYPGYELFSTGHSLGGGLAVTVGLALKSTLNQNITIVNFGGLKVGNIQFGAYLDEVMNTDKYLDVVNDNDANEDPLHGFLRVVHVDDIVPQVPPTVLYAHGGVELYINKKELPQSIDDTIIVGKYEYTGLALDILHVLEGSDVTIGDLLPLGIVYAHADYFANIYGCNATLFNEFEF